MIDIHYFDCFFCYDMFQKQNTYLIIYNTKKILNIKIINDLFFDQNNK